jgi:hypothetical protein
VANRPDEARRRFNHLREAAGSTVGEALGCSIPEAVLYRRVGKREPEFARNGRYACLSRMRFEDDALCRQDVAKDIENEIAIAQCRRRILAAVAHLLHGFRA